ncbi:MAG: hypothetical protein NT002_00660 [candidate division Zixibacteria bacterium]|nr:hypothetical protein [candidate division Zixibacteria bacterium]
MAKPICGRLLQLHRDTSEINYHLNALEIDHQLLMEGWQIVFAIDFYEIFQYLYPLHNIIISDDELDKKSRIEDTFHYAARSYLFDHPPDVGEPILLPPFVFELGTHITRRLANAFKFRTAPTDFYKSIEKELTSEELLRFEEALEQLQVSSGSIEQIGARNELIDLVKSKLHKYFKIIYFARNRYRQALNDLILSKPARFRYINDAIPEVPKEVYSLKREEVIISPWYDLFSRLRSHWDTDFRDAYAIEQVVRINEWLQSQKKKKLVLLLSSATSMFSVMNWDIDDFLCIKELSELKKMDSAIGSKTFAEIIEICKAKRTAVPGRPYDESRGPCIIKTFEGHQVRALRTIDTVLHYHFCCGGQFKTREERWQSVLSEVSDRKSVFGRHQRWLSPHLDGVRNTTCTHYDYDKDEVNDGSNCLKALDKTELPGVTNAIKEFYKWLDKIQYSEVFANSRHFSDAIKGVGINAKDEERNLALTRFIEVVKNKGQEIDQFFDRELKGLLQDSHYWNQIRDNVIRTVYPNLLHGIRYYVEIMIRHADRITFESDAIRRHLQSLRKSALKDDDLNSARESYVELVQVADTDTPNSETMLLSTLLMFTFGQYDQCKSLIDSFFTDDKRERRWESSFTYFQVLTLTLLGCEKNDESLINEARHIAEASRTNYPNDPLILYLIGTIELIIIENNVEINMRPFEEVIESFLNAEEAAKGNSACELAILNNHAEYIVLRKPNEREWLEKALPIVDKMINSSVPRSHWHPEVFGTIARVFSKWAALLEQDSRKSDAADYLKTAVDYINEAIECAQSWGMPSDIIKKLEMLAKELKN